MADPARPRRRLIPDVGAGLARLLARPVAAFSGVTAAEVRDQVEHPPESATDAMLSAGTRTVAWLMAGVVFFAAAALGFAVEDAISAGPSRLGPYLWPPMAVCLLTGVLSSIHVAVAYYTSEARWRHAGPVWRALATPGNHDLVIAAVMVALVAVAIATG